VPLARSLRTEGHAVVALRGAARAAAKWLLAAQLASCPNASSLALRGDLFGGSAYHRSRQAVQVNVYDGNRYAFSPCLGRTRAVRAQVEALHRHLWDEAQQLLHLLADAQSQVQGRAADTSWLADALRIGPPGPGHPATHEATVERQRRQVLLRSMAYANGASAAEPAPPSATMAPELRGGAAAPEWTVQRPHQDATWLSLIVQSAGGLLTMPHGPHQAATDEGAASSSGSHRRPARTMSWSSVQQVQTEEDLDLIVLVGGRLAEASGGFFPASCHGVSRVTAEHSVSEASLPPRFSWIFLYTANCCDFYELPGLLSCGWGPNSTRRPFAVRGVLAKEWCVDAQQDSCRIWGSAV